MPTPESENRRGQKPQKPPDVYHTATHQDAAAAGFDDAFIYAELAKPAAERQLPLLRLLGEEGQAPFAAWAANSNRIPY